MMHYIDHFYKKLHWEYLQFSNPDQANKRKQNKKKKAENLDILKNYYKTLQAEDLLRKKIGDTLFIFGSGYSVNDLTKDEISKINGHDTISFNWFLYQNILPIKFHLVREVVTTNDLKLHRSKLEEWSTITHNSPWYKNTTFLMQYDNSATGSIDLIHEKLIPQDNEIYLFKTYSRSPKVLPPKNIKRGFVHSAGTLSDCINFGYAMGYKKIVCVGVDLYDRRYFFLKKDETRFTDLNRGNSCDDIHRTASPMLDNLKKWKEYFQKQDVTLYTYNPKSLLKNVIDIWDWNNQKT